jgi:hypothetical protein
MTGLAALLCFTFLSVAIGSKVIERYTEIARLKEIRQIMTDAQKNTVDVMIKSMELQQRLKDIDENLLFDAHFIGRKKALLLEEALGRFEQGVGVEDDVGTMMSYGDETAVNES